MIYQLIGFFLIIIGISHLVKQINQLDMNAVQVLQKIFHKKPWLPFFQEIWFFGRTSFTLITLFLLSTINWKLGTSALLVFLVGVGVEQIFKGTFNRARPYADNQEIRMLQLIRPHDPSFPSGDALRIWYLALVMPAAVGGMGVFLTAAILVALLVTLGRVVMGVHYPTDTITGTGLGMISAGTTLWIWQYLGLL
jgi:undecaprenyl-diphosphatase